MNEEKKKYVTFYIDEEVHQELNKRRIKLEMENLGKRIYTCDLLRKILGMKPKEE